MPTREDAYTLMTSHVKNENLQKHMLAVEAALRFYARKYGEDEEIWAMTGLLHDCDYEEYPDLREHTWVSARWLREGGYDERIIYAILAHNDLNTDYPRTDLLSKALYACDEITGMITATAPITKCHSRKLSTILPELIALFSLQPAAKEYAALH
ncbi:MAG TPA: HDIG domain-containing protein [Ktedonobacteraceae bacterium]|jgi:putative nucleotidyltransferase with HDIG domain|nr:HDIG domain-containing protein [Ktedonobacteraceae bacterium]